MTRGRTTAAALALVGACAPLGSCSSGSPGSDPAATPAPPASIAITLRDGTVSPRGTRVKARVGQPVRLRIDADTAGELHVHSTPEQEVEFPAGSSTRRLTIDRPGIVDVEDHALDQVIVQLEVS